MRTKTRLGIMGGTFDPIHFGHLVTAEEALVQFNLDRVIFMPTGQPARKTHRDVAPAEHRYLMTVLATASHPDFDVSRMEVERPGLTYTVDTLKEFRESQGPQTELFFITGADAVWDIVTWKDAGVLQELCTFIAATRPGYDMDAISKEYAKEQENLKLEFIEVPALAISSTDIRRRVAEKRPIHYLLPEDVVSYIEKNELYRNAGA